jgi:hypothetical protein
MAKRFSGIGGGLRLSQLPKAQARPLYSHGGKAPKYTPTAEKVKLLSPPVAPVEAPTTANLKPPAVPKVKNLTVTKTKKARKT